MSQEDSELWTRARRARDKLVDQFLDHPDVSLVDIGYPMERGQITKKELVLRVHVRRSLAREALGLPTEIDDIPVHVVVADYRLE
jgi:hypothetical protein